MTVMRGQNRYAYGEVSKGVREYIARMPVGSEFRHADIASDLEANQTTVSAAVLKLAREANPAVTLGTQPGYYRKVREFSTGEPAAPAAQKPAAKPPVEESPKAGQYMEIIGVYKDGSVLMRAENDTLWKAEQQ